MRWKYNRIGISTRRRKKDKYRDDKKQYDLIKVETNKFIGREILKFQAYYRQITRHDELPDLFYFNLDGQFVNTTTHWVEECNVPLENIDICSSTIEFKPRGYFGTAVDWFKQRDSNDYRYDCVFLDFCGTANNENLEALVTLFKKRLIESIAILAFTFSHRGGPKKLDYYHQQTFGGLVTVCDIARKYGFFIGNVSSIENKEVTTYVCKVMEIQDALAYGTGIQCDRNNFGPDKWVISSEY